MVGNDTSILPIGANPLNLTSSQYTMIEEFTTLAHQQVKLQITPIGLNVDGNISAWGIFLKV